MLIRSAWECTGAAFVVGPLKPAPERKGGRRMKILVIDDNPAFRHSLAGALGRGGYEVIVADDGEQGLAVFRKETPDLVICDLIMPRRNGVDTVFGRKWDQTRLPPEHLPQRD
jgi:PleD family two-component response regulator